MPVPVVAEQISRVPTRETVAATLRGWIIDGTLAPAEVLRDADLARAFGTSRTPVREALLRLEHEGLVESQPGRWTRVAPLAPQSLAIVYPVWVDLEILAARMAATSPGTAARLAPAEDAALAYAAAIGAVVGGAGEQLMRTVHEADARFHDAVLAATGNPSLITTLIPLRWTIRRYENTCPRMLACDLDTVEEHAAILDAMRNGDPDSAAEATRAHMEHIHQRLCAGWDMHES